MLDTQYLYQGIQKHCSLFSPTNILPTMITGTIDLCEADYSPTSPNYTIDFLNIPETFVITSVMISLSLKPPLASVNWNDPLVKENFNFGITKYIFSKFLPEKIPMAFAETSKNMIKEYLKSMTEFYKLANSMVSTAESKTT
ncbi:hypothetical protein BB561_004843 [Smittium simulii]|uniref:Uncharacterized protein n=1 Tax=Smittium simulii TaxID=133385 RepID=A0A2T9YDU2_9FUNG|nr:hypothetical protein BB561_004843 [Smittium simulii]